MSGVYSIEHHVIILCCWIITEIKYLLYNNFNVQSSFFSSMFTNLLLKGIVFVLSML